MSSVVPRHEDTIRYLDGRWGSVDDVAQSLPGEDAFVVIDARTQLDVKVERVDPPWSGIVLWREVK